MLLAYQVVFQTKVYHPGINEEGSICIPILRDEVCPRNSLIFGNAIALLREVNELFLFNLLCGPTSGNHRSRYQLVSRVNHLPVFGHKQDVPQYSQSFKKS